MPIPKREGVMLCYPVDDGRVSRLTYNGFFLLQPKYNGERCRVEWFKGHPVLLSSYGHEFRFLQHIAAVLSELDPEDQLRFDGELYIHGTPRETIHSLASASRVTAHPDCQLIQFHIFDIQDEGVNQLSRITAVTELYERKFKDTYQIQLVPTEFHTPDTWIERTVEYCSQGYEGSILRNMSALYTPKRSVNILKFKPTEEDTYTIVHINEAISIEGEPKEMVGSFLVQGDDMTVFSVGAGKLTHDQRIEYWKRKEEIKGRQLKVKHEKIKTINEIPIAAVALEVL